jgi:large subunit ribosomal protein L25
MSAKIQLEAELRTQTGKRDSRRMRDINNKVIGTLYGANKDPLAIALDHFKINKALENEAFYSSILTLTINGQAEKVVIKAIQRHPSKPKILHMDFFRINPKEKLTMHIPLHFIGEDISIGVKEGGVVSHFMNEVEIRCLPADLPEFIDVDLSKTGMNQYVHLTDLKLPQGVELTALIHGKIEEHNRPVAHVHMPQLIKEEPVEAVAISPEVEATRVSGEKEEAAAAAESKEKESGKEEKGKGK